MDDSIKKSELIWIQANLCVVYMGGEDCKMNRDLWAERHSPKARANNWDGGSWALLITNLTMDHDGINTWDNFTANNSIFLTMNNYIARKSRAGNGVSRGGNHPWIIYWGRMRSGGNTLTNNLASNGGIFWRRMSFSYLLGVKTTVMVRKWWTDLEE